MGSKNRKKSAAPQAKLNSSTSKSKSNVKIKNKLTNKSLKQRNEEAQQANQLRKDKKSQLNSLKAHDKKRELPHLSEQSNKRLKLSSAASLSDDELEDKYFSNVAKQKKLTAAKKLENFLPVITQKGQFIQNGRYNDNMVEESEASASEEEEESVIEPLAAPSASVPSPLLPADLASRRHRYKLLLSELCENILQSPENNLSVYIGELFKLLLKESDRIIVELSLLSITNVLADLLPSYHIKLPSSEEEYNSKQISQQVKNVWKYERSLLSSYQQLISFVRNNLRLLNNPHSPPSTIVLASVKSLVYLLPRAYDFNYRSEMIELACYSLASQHEEVRNDVMQGLIDMFKADQSMQSTLEAVKLIRNIIKNKKTKIATQFLQVLLFLPLNQAILQAKLHSDSHSKSKAKQRGVKIDNAELKRDLEESSAEVSLAQRQAIQKELLDNLFFIYFHYLKLQLNNQLMPIILTGLARYAHLINIELVLDLLESLKLSLSNHKIQLSTKLSAVQTAFKVLIQHQQTIQIDLKQFYDFIYLSINLCNEESNSSDCFFALYNCIRLMFIEYRSNAQTIRIAAVIKRLAQEMLHISNNHHVIMFQLLLSELFHLYGNKLKSLLIDSAVEINENTAISYNPNIEDPDLTAANNTSLYEINLLAHSSNPSVNHFCSLLANSKDFPLNLTQTKQQTSKLLHNIDTFHKNDALKQVINSIPAALYATAPCNPSLNSNPVNSSFLQSCAQFPEHYLNSRRHHLQLLQSKLAH
jgi:nucleolar complex protein 3